MLVIISSPVAVEKEAEKINELFKMGLKVLHLRKPNSTKEEIGSLLNQIKPLFYERISLHQHHSLANFFGIRRLHFTSMEREKAIGLDKSNCTISCSIHSVEEYNNLPNKTFDYCFLSPVFTSTSKPNYEGKIFDLSKADKTKTTKIIALGGISSQNCNKPKEIGFNGIALLGSIWNENPMESFLKTTQSYEL